VVESGGKLIFETGAVIKDSYRENGGGNPGVYVKTGGTFTMKGGEISGNSATYDGGVYVMNGSFTKTGGIIYGSNADAKSNSNGYTVYAEDSGETERYGSIAGSHFCHPIRAVVLEGVWAMVKSGKGPLFAKYGKLPGRMGKKKSAAAAARKTAGLAWLLIKRRKYYRGMSNEALAKKPRYYNARSNLKCEFSL
jgi:hypothetical protein